MLINLVVPDGLRPETQNLVAGFAKALAEKLHAAEIKYAYSDNWMLPDWEKECRANFLAHINKGDPRDVAIYCAFMWKHGWPTIAPFTPISLDTIAAAEPNNAIKHRLRMRLTDILFRHLRLEDDALSDVDLIEQVMRRFLHSRQDALIDPNE